MASKIGMNNLPDEMLIKIFTNLEFGDLLDSKLVCTRWLKIISTSQKFHKARKIYLTNCLLAPNLPPISVLNKSLCQFEVLTIGENVKVFGVQDMYEMWKGITGNIKRLKLEWKKYSINRGIQIKDAFGDNNLLELLFPSLQVLQFKGHAEEYSDIKSVIEKFNCISKNISIKIDVNHEDNTVIPLLIGYPTILKHVAYHDYPGLELELLATTENLQLQSLDVCVNPENEEYYNRCIEKLSGIRKLRIDSCMVLPDDIPLNAINVNYSLPPNITPGNYRKLFNLLRALPVRCKKILSSYFNESCVMFHEPLLPEITFEMDQTKCYYCFKSMSENGGVLRTIYYDYLNKDHEYIKLLRPQLKNVTHLKFAEVPFELATDSILISILSEMTNIKEISGRDFASNVLLSWPQMPKLQKFCGTFSNEPRHALENFVFHCGAITELKLIIFGGFDFPFEIFLCNLPRLRKLKMTTTVTQMDAFVKNIPKCDTRVQSISMKDKISGVCHTAGVVTTDIFSKIPSLRNIFIIDSGVSRTEYYTLLKQGITKSDDYPYCEMCDAMAAIGVKYTEYTDMQDEFDREMTQFKLVTPKDVINELLSMEDGATNMETE